MFGFDMGQMADIGKKFSDFMDDMQQRLQRIEDKIDALETKLEEKENAGH